MKVTICDAQGNELGSFEGPSVWRDVLLFASERWEEQARGDSILALEEILASRA